MKHKNILGTLSLTLFMGLMLSACNHDESLSGSIKPVILDNGLHIYPVSFECSAPGYQDVNASRATSYDWKNGATILVRFKTGSSFVRGYLRSESGNQQLYAYDDLPDTSQETECQLAYFEDSNGDYLSLNPETQCFDIYNDGKFVRSTTIPVSSDTINISEQTALYRTNDGKYTSSNNYYNIKATIAPRTWRLRFSGDDGTTIILPKYNNDIDYWAKWIWSTTKDTEIKANTKTIKLTVNNGYTPYIYGFFENGVTNKITVENGLKAYTRNIDVSYINNSSSCVFTLPTASNYSSLGWTQQNAVLFEVPYTAWEATFDDVKKEMAARGFETLLETNNSKVYYDAKHREAFSYYEFTSGKLTGAYVEFDNNTTFEEVNNYIASLDGVTLTDKQSDYEYQYMDVKTASVITVTAGSEYVTVGYSKPVVNLSVSPASLSFSEKGGAESISVACNFGWTASCSEAWCSITPASGSGNGIVAVSVSTNSSYNERTATITIRDAFNSITREVTITQEAKSEEMLINRDDYDSDISLDNK